MSIATLSKPLLKGSLLVIIVALSVLIPPSHATVVLVGPNVSIVNLTQDRQQVEPTIAVDPRNSNIIVAGAQDLRLKSSGEHRWHGYYRSTDGGSTWTQSLLPGFPGDSSPQGMASPLRKFNGTTDPVLAFDRKGNVYYTGIALNITSPTSAGWLTAFVAKYVNDGADYAGTVLIGGVTGADKPWMAVDNTGGPNDGNVYLAFDATLGNIFASVFTRSTDGGGTFSVPFFVPADKTGELPGIAVAPNGDVFVSTYAFDPITGADLHRINVSRLTNGGTTLVETVFPADPVTSLPSPLPGGSFRVFTIPQIAADARGLYLVWDDFRSADADVFMSHSTDGGSTWTSASRVNDVALGQQFFPTIAASGGIVSVAWYDSRFNSGTTITSLDVFYSQSTDGGSTFSSSVRITSTSFNPEIVKRTDAPIPNDPFLGDYIHIAASPTAVHPIWADNRNACDTVDPVFGCVDQDVFTATITVSAPAFHDVAVPNVKSSRSFAYAGVASNPITVNATVSNLGSTAETFTVTLRANASVVGTQNVNNLAAAAITVVTFSWNTNTFAVGNYTLSAQASAVSGETNTSNNSFTDGTFRIKKAGDVNGDGVVTVDDVLLAAIAWGGTYNPNADQNGDGVITLDDVLIVAVNWK